MVPGMDADSGSPAPPFGRFLLQTGTAGPETDDTYEFTMADWDGDGRPDLVAIRKRRTGARRTEVHILSGAGEFKQFLLQTGTALPETDDTYKFTMADWDGDGRPDLVAIKKSGTDTQTTEVHILSGASEFKEFLLQTPTALPETDETYDFAMADWDGGGRLNLVAIKKRGTDTGTTEVHVLGAAE
jgi:VCBS repeat protein